MTGKSPLKYVLVRDDDVSFFTRPEVLQRVHEPLLQAGLPLNVALIPAVRADIQGSSPDRVYFHREGLRYEPFIPPEMRGKPESFPFGRNADLCTFLQHHPNIEVTQHGYSHEWLDDRPEYAGPYSKALAERLRAGRQIITEDLGRAPRFFVPPWDQVSRDPIGTIRDLFDGIALRKVRRALLPLATRVLARRCLSSRHCLWDRHFLWLGHPGYLVSRFRPAEAMRAQVMATLDQDRVLVLVAHHWEFFYDWAGEDRAFLQAWHETLSDLMARPDVRFVSFSGLYALLCRSA